MITLYSTEQWLSLSCDAVIEFDPADQFEIMDVSMIESYRDELFEVSFFYDDGQLSDDQGGILNGLVLINPSAVVPVVYYQGEFFKAESFLWYLFYGELVTEFLYLDSDSRNTRIENIVPKNYQVKKLDYSREQLEELFELDVDTRELFWFSQPTMSRSWNNYYPFLAANRKVEGKSLVDIFGKLYSIDEVLACLGGEGTEPTINFVEEYSDSSDEVVNYVSDYQTSVRGAVGSELIKSCFYCGDNTQITRDHIIPVSAKGGRRNYDRRDTVDCCRQCNSILGNRPFYTVEDRALYLAQRLAEKYKKILRSHTYTEAELWEFGPRLKSMLRANKNAKSYMIARINHCHQVAGELYAPEKAEHLRGVTTNAKRSAYKIIEEFVFHKGNQKDYVERAAEESDTEVSVINGILNESIHPDVALQFKYDQGYPLEVSLRKIRKVLLSARS